jgi:cytochrome c-type biogenesis protein CcmH
VRADRVRLALAAAALCACLPAFAQNPQAQPLADDPVLESRVIELSQKLRCLVCQNETIAGSRAPLAIDLRNQVRQQLASGKSEDEVVDFLVDRYGDFVLYDPPFKSTTVLLWLGPGALALLGIGALLVRLRRRQHEIRMPRLSADERARARALLGETDSESPEESRK